MGSSVVFSVPLRSRCPGGCGIRARVAGSFGRSSWRPDWSAARRGSAAPTTALWSDPRTAWSPPETNKRQTKKKSVPAKVLCQAEQKSSLGPLDMVALPGPCSWVPKLGWCSPWRAATACRHPEDKENRTRSTPNRCAKTVAMPVTQLKSTHSIRRRVQSQMLSLRSLIRTWSLCTLAGWIDIWS